jgi:hypothetical protein
MGCMTAVQILSKISHQRTHDRDPTWTMDEVCVLSLYTSVSDEKHSCICANISSLYFRILASLHSCYFAYLRLRRQNMATRKVDQPWFDAFFPFDDDLFARFQYYSGPPLTLQLAI